ncbi:MAG: hypothetical protein ACI37Z_03410 [Candidatus Gastranaerophilaceae bacterium]
MSSEQYEKIKTEVTGRMNSKRFVALLMIMLSAIACVYIGVKTTSYYLLVVFGALIIYYVYEFCSYTSLLKKQNYIIAELTCEESQRSHLGYDMVSSKIFRFKINRINNEPAKAFYNKWNKEHELKNVPQFDDETDLQFTNELRISDLSAKRRENNQRFHSGDNIYAIFLTNNKKPLTFTNAPLLFTGNITKQEDSEEKSE